jgi:hypothetical protein
MNSLHTIKHMRANVRAHLRAVWPFLCCGLES